MARIQARAANSSDFEDLTTLTRMELEQRKCDAYNRTRGKLHEVDGYDCPECLNRGFFYGVREGFNGMPTLYQRFCKCRQARLSIKRMRQSGLKDVLDECTFDAYIATEPWQRNLKAKAMQFTQDDKAPWFFVGGASGGGKTHLCTAICAHYLKSMRVHYMLWENELKKLNALVNAEEEYSQRMDFLKEVDVLYIDDFLKPVYRGGELLPPTQGDMRRAYELLNQRYIEKKITIISSERYSTEILDLDQAVGGRIVQRARGYVLNVQRDPSRNYRTKAGTML